MGSLARLAALACGAVLARGARVMASVAPAASPLPAAGTRRRRGFTLVEMSVALWILLVALLSGLALVMQQPRVVRRIDAARQAVAVMEWTLEEMRAGLIPLQSTPDVGWTVSSFVVGSPAPDLKVAVAVTPAATPGLYRVSLTARYTVYGQLLRRRLETMIWRPDGGPP
jgi:prepilin-type N-terminal cleavage/methylation domain-containing protein